MKGPIEFISTIEKSYAEWWAEKNKKKTKLTPANFREKTFTHPWVPQYSYNNPLNIHHIKVHAAERQQKKLLSSKNRSVALINYLLFWNLLPIDKDMAPLEECHR